MPLSPLTPDEMKHRLRVLWFKNVYTNIPDERSVGWMPDPNPPSSFAEPPPPEYISPFPNPSYWPPTNEPLFPDGDQWITWSDFRTQEGLFWPPPYPPLPPYPPEMSIPQQSSSNNYFEELCCIGFNPEDSILEAIISVKRTSGYGGNLCSPGPFESVGFWFVEPSTTQPFPNPWPVNPPGLPAPPNPRWIGESRVRVFDIPRLLIADAGHTGWLRYSVRLLLSPDMAQFIIACSNIPARLPRMHCVLGWNQVVNANNFNGAGIIWGNVFLAAVQFPKKSQWGITKLRERLATESQAFPVHVAALKNKKFLFWAGSGNDPNPNLDLSHTAAIYDPESDTFTPLVDPATYDPFCSGHTILADGRVLIAGGTAGYGNQHGGGVHEHHFPGIKTTVIFDPDDNTWNFQQDLQHGRWYPTLTMLADGSVLAIAGHTDLNDITLMFRGAVEFGPTFNPAQPDNNLNPNYQDYPNFNPPPPNPLRNFALIRHENTDKDIFVPKLNSWVNVADAMPSISDMPHFFDGGYPRLFLLQDASFFCSTPLGTLPPPIPLAVRPPANGCYRLTSAGQWINVNNGANAPGGFTETAIHLPIAAGDLDKILVTNGTNAFVCVPLDTGTPPWISVGRGLTGVKRTHGNGVIMADGTILLVGGINTSDAFGADTDKFGVKPTEIFDPVTGLWKIGASITRTRSYHSFAILQHDGRILIGGSNKNAQQGTPSRELSLELYTPDYLWRGPRPEFGVTPDVVARSSDINVVLGKNWLFRDLDPSKFFLIRLYSVTHAFGIDQRCIKLSPKGTPAQTDSSFSITIPANANLVPPGYYYLFLASVAGCPSMGHVIRVI